MTRVPGAGTPASGTGAPGLAAGTPARRRVVVEADGGSRGNPGPAGYGAVVLAAGPEEVLAERAAGPGGTTNDVTGDRGLVAGLRAVIELDATAVEARMDSTPVVERMSGHRQVEHPARKPLARKAAALVGEIGSVTFGWVPRARNGRADAPADRAMDAQVGR